MADSETRLDMKIVVDNEKRRVLFAEADGDFVDILFSFLTLPFGTILRLIRKSQSVPSTLGSFGTLYQSVMSLGDECFKAEELKDMLLHPRSFYDCHLQQLKINIDGTEAKYFVCSDFHGTGNSDFSCRRHMSLYKNTMCPFCTDPMSDVQLPFEYISKGNVFVSDNLEVTPLSAASSFSILNRNKVSVFDLEERTLSIGVEEGMSILRASLNPTKAIPNGLLHKGLVFKEPKQEN